LHVLVTDQLEGTALALSALGAGTVALEDHDAIGDGGSEEGSAVGETSKAAGRVERDVAQTVAHSAEQKGHVASEPGELKSLDEGDEALLGRLARRRRGHCRGVERLFVGG